MRCFFCNICLSEKVCRIHMETCPERFKSKDDTAQEKPLEECTKRDLIVYILSERDDFEEFKLSKLNKQPLLELALEIKNGG